MHNFLQKSLCPYCYTSFFLWDKMYRCQALPQVCLPVSDTIYKQHFGIEKPLGRVISSGITDISDLCRFLVHNDQTRCTDCASLTMQALCPNCHGHLPKNYQEFPVRPILLVGDDMESLQAYRNALFHQLKATQGHMVGMSIQDLPDGQGFMTSFDISHGKRGKMPQFISTFPMVSWKELKSLSLAFDVSKLYGVLALFSGKKLLNDGGDYALSSLMDLSDFSGRQKNFWARMPLALTIDDMMTWQTFVPGGSVLWGTGRHNKGYDTEDGRNVSLELQACFGHWSGLNALQLLKKNFKKHRLFGISAQRHSMGRVMPYARVEDPYFWLLYQQKILEKML